jgi:phosphoserine phosphatase
VKPPLTITDQPVWYPAPPVWVYANGAADRPLLELADVPVRVRPYRVLHPAAGTGATR